MLEELAVRLVAMDHKLRIGATAQLVQIHADALAVSFHTKRNGAIQEPEEQVNEGQNQAEQGGDADKLREELPGAARK